MASNPLLYRIAEGEAEVEPDGMADDLRWKAMVIVALRVGGRRYVAVPQVERWLM